MEKTRVIIVDDDNNAINLLKLIINENFPNIEIIAWCNNVADAIKIINSNRPDLAFLDVELPDGYGFDIIPKVEFLAGLWGVKSPPSYILHDDDTSNDAMQKIMSSEDYDFSSSSILSPMLREAPNLLTLSLEGNIRPTVYFYNRTGYVQVDENWRLMRFASDVKPAPLLRGRYLATSLFNRLLPRWHYAMSILSTSSYASQTLNESGGDEQETQTPPSSIVDIPIHVLALKTDEAFCEFLGVDAHAYGEFKRESIPRLKFSSQFDTWLKTGRPIEID